MTQARNLAGDQQASSNSADDRQAIQRTESTDSIGSIGSQQIKSALNQHEGSLVRYAQHFVGDLDRARDVVQDAFVKLCGQLQDHGDSQNLAELPPMFSDQSQIAKWLYRVCRNRAIDVSRKENRMKLAKPEQLNGKVSSQMPPSAAIEQRETTATVMNQVSELPDNQQEVLRLKFQAGLSYKEIAEVTGLTTSNVGFILHTAIKRLRTRLADA